MLVIRDEQIQHFIAADDERLTEVVSAAVQAANTSRVAGYDEKKLRDMASVGIETARSRSVSRAEDIAVFVALMFEISPKFYEQPTIAEVLVDTNYPVSDRLEQLPERVPEDAWAAAERLYDPNFWFGGAAEAPPATETSVDYTDLAAKQFEKLKKLEQSAAANPSEAAAAELNIETDRLRFLQNAAKGDPRSRAANAITTARKSALNKAIVQPA